MGQHHTNPTSPSYALQKTTPVGHVACSPQNPPRRHRACPRLSLSLGALGVFLTCLVNQSFFIRALSCGAPFAASFLLPPALQLWVESHRFRLPLTDAFHAVIIDYSRTSGDSLWVTTFYQLPPFLLLAALLLFFARRLSALRLAALSLSGLALICLVQIPMTIRILKAIPAGEAEFVEFRYLLISVLSVFLLCFLYFPLLAIKSNANKNA